MERTLVLARDIMEDDEATVPDSTWVVIKNLKPVKNKSNEFSYDESCIIQRGGIVKVTGIDGDRVLVRYSIRGHQFGTSCPSGALFFITKKEFSGMTAEYHKVQKLKKLEKDLIRRMIEG